MTSYSRDKLTCHLTFYIYMYLSVRTLNIDDDVLHRVVQNVPEISRQLPLFYRNSPHSLLITSMHGFDFYPSKLASTL